MDDVRRAEPRSPSTCRRSRRGSRPQGRRLHRVREPRRRGPRARSACSRTLGFDRAGHHRNKARHPVPAGRRSASSSTRRPPATPPPPSERRGTTVCDIGFAVADARRRDGARHGARRRALQPADSVPARLDIPAIRGPSGSVLHFIDDSVGPRPGLGSRSSAPRRRPTGAGLTPVDHLAQTMSLRRHAVLDAVLHLALRHREVADGRRLRPRRAGAQPGDRQRPTGGLRITLNGADNHRTLAGGFLAETFGASVQHLALATDDIFATARSAGRARVRAAADAAELLRRPRRPVRPARPVWSRRMQARWRALRPRRAAASSSSATAGPSPAGCSSRSSSASGGYAGFGAPNAPFRIAAQKRAQLAGR